MSRDNFELGSCFQIPRQRNGLSQTKLDDQVTTNREAMRSCVDELGNQVQAVRSASTRSCTHFWVPGVRLMG